MIETRPLIDAHVIGIDETSHYTFPAKHVPCIDRILAVYLYDANEHTYLCEVTPSHFMHFLYYAVRLTEAGFNLCDEKRNALYEEYEIENSNEDRYMHCRDLERAAAAGLPENYDHYGATEVSYDDVDYDDQILDLIEHLNGNPPF